MIRLPTIIIDTSPTELDYKNAHGRIGRKENSYKMLMELKNSGPEITDKLINCFPNGINRSISDKEALKFLSWNK
jgi:hypothetical protein